MHSVGTWHPHAQHRHCELHLPDGSQPPKTLDEQVCLKSDSLSQQGKRMHSIGTKCELHLKWLPTHVCIQIMLSDS